MSRMQCCEWFKRFKEGRTSLSEDSRPGRPSKSTFYYFTVQEAAEEVSISVRSCHAILIGKLQMHLISAKFVPRLLTDVKKRT